MGASFYLLLLGTSFTVVIGLAVFSACGWYRSQTSFQSSSASQQTTTTTTTPNRQTKQQSMTQVSPGMSAMSADAFTIKEMKKEKLLDKGRRRYLDLHPEFVPPTKAEKAL